ncbi:MAG: hypothetical protein P8Y53_25440 [Pseudolabrys sp.]
MNSSRQGRVRPVPMRGERLQIMLSPKELAALDDFRFKARMPSRAAAVRELFRLGLAGAGLAQDASGKRSADFGVLGDTEESPGAARG